MIHSDILFHYGAKTPSIYFLLMTADKLYIVEKYALCRHSFLEIVPEKSQNLGSITSVPRMKTMAPLHVATLTVKRELPKYEIIF